MIFILFLVFQIEWYWSLQNWSSSEKSIQEHNQKSKRILINFAELFWWALRLKWNWDSISSDENPEKNLQSVWKYWLEILKHGFPIWIQFNELLIYPSKSLDFVIQFTFSSFPYGKTLAAKYLWFCNSQDNAKPGPAIELSCPHKISKSYATKSVLELMALYLTSLFLVYGNK